MFLSSSLYSIGKFKCSSEYYHANIFITFNKFNKSLYNLQKNLRQLNQPGKIRGLFYKF